MDDRKRQARWYSILAGAALALYLCWLTLQPFVGVMTWAIVLVVTFYPIHRRLVSWLGRPGWAALVSTTIVVFTILAPVAFVTMMIINEVPALMEKSREAFQFAIGPESPLPEPILAAVRSQFDGEQTKSPEKTAELAQRAGGMLAGPLFGFTYGVVSGIIQLFLMVFAIYYLFRDGAQLVGWLQHTLPLEVAQNKEIFHRTREMIDASVYGVIVLAVLQGILGGLAFLVLGLPNPFIWGVVMIILSMIPVTGSFLIWAPAAIYLMFTGEWGKAAGLTAWGVLVIGMVDNFLRPYVMGQRARLHELLLFFSVLGGLAAFGMAGIVLGPVIIAIALGLLDVIRLSDRPSDTIRREPGLAEQSAQISEDAAKAVPSLANNQPH